MTAHGAARVLVRLAAVIAPGHRRADLTEQWLADLAGAAELGLSPLSVATGALRTSVSPSIWRSTPALSGGSPPIDPGDALPVRVIGWRLVAGLAGALLLGLALFSVGVLIPYLVNGVHLLPLDAVSTHVDQWPLGSWDVPLALVGLLGMVVLILSAFAVPVVCVEALVSLCTGHASTGGRAGPVVGLAAVGALALAVLASFTTDAWRALLIWWTD